VNRDGTSSGEPHDVVLRLRPFELEWREVDGEVIVLDGTRSQYMVVNGSGAVLWQSLATGATRSELANVLTGRFEIDRAQAEQDVDQFVGELAGLSLLTEEPCDAG
jgi:hypothetical protein